MDHTVKHTMLRLAVIGLVVVTVGFLGVAARQSASSAPSAQLGRGDDVTTTDAGGPVTVADGVVPDGVTVFDDQYPGVANLEPDLLQALRDAATDAATDGIDLHVNSGWRSRRYQEQLRREAVAQYGSEREAARWVATADGSAHVSGDAVDIGPVDSAAWLSQHGSEYGLCQIYGNEPWHYELRPTAASHGCPPAYADPTHDPRMHQRAEAPAATQTAAPSNPPPRAGTPWWSVDTAT